MHNSIINVRKKLISIKNNNIHIQLLIDGNYFNPVKVISDSKIEFIPHLCIEGGDNKYSAIAAASILAKVSRDNYIVELVKEYPDLAEKYGIDTNKGYGAKKHLDGIQKHGITKWHRKTFGICKVSKMSTPFENELKIET
jgi:ribonuclease HII